MTDPLASDTAYIPPSTPPPPLLPVSSLQHLSLNGWLPLPHLPPSLQHSTSTLLTHLPTFFSLPSHQQSHLYPRTHGTESGYYHIPREKTYLTLRHTHHPNSELETLASALWTDAATFLHRILRDIAVVSDMPPDIWDELLAGTATMPASVGESSGTLLRMFRYKPHKGGAERHTDLGLLTLCVGTDEGLEVLDLVESEVQGREVWRDVGKGAVVLVGETLAGLSGGGMRAGVHRVKSTERGRGSLVFALRHGWRFDVELGSWGLGEGRVKARELYRWLGVGVVNVNAEEVRREVQRERLESLKRQAKSGEEDMVSGGNEGEVEGGRSGMG